MITPKHRPGCYVDDPAKVAPRGRVMEGYAGGVAPGHRNPFFDEGRSCGNASSPAVWAESLRHTPACAGCQRARRGLEVAAGIAGQYDAPFAWREIETAQTWYERLLKEGA